MCCLCTFIEADILLPGHPYILEVLHDIVSSALFPAHEGYIMYHLESKNPANKD